MLVIIRLNLVCSVLSIQIVFSQVKQKKKMKGGGDLHRQTVIYEVLKRNYNAESATIGNFYIVV